MTSQRLERGQREHNLYEDVPPIDFSHFRQFTSGHLQLEKEILGLFLTEVPKLISDCEKAPSEKEWRRATHTLKGAARSLGAWTLANIASDLEQKSDQIADETFRRKGVDYLSRETVKIKRFLQTQYVDIVGEINAC